LWASSGSLAFVKERNNGGSSSVASSCLWLTTAASDRWHQKRAVPRRPAQARIERKQHEVYWCSQHMRNQQSVQLSRTQLGQMHPAGPKLLRGDRSGRWRNAVSKYGWCCRQWN
jgi:hypothetical protein